MGWPQQLAAHKHGEIVEEGTMKRMSLIAAEALACAHGHPGFTIIDESIRLPRDIEEERRRVAARLKGCWRGDGVVPDLPRKTAERLERKARRSKG